MRVGVTDATRGPGTLGEPGFLGADDRRGSEIRSVAVAWTPRIWTTSPTSVCDSISTGTWIDSVPLMWTASVGAVSPWSPGPRLATGETDPLDSRGTLMKRVLIPLAALLLVPTSAAPAAAAKPLGLEDGDYDTGEILITDMCAFPVVYQGWGHSSYREWQDETDFPIKGLFQAHGTDSYRHAPAGPMVSGQFHSSVLRTDFSYDADTDTLSAASRSLTSASHQVVPAGRTGPANNEEGMIMRRL